MKNNVLIVLLVAAGLLLSVFFAYRFSDSLNGETNEANTSAVVGTPVPKRPTIVFEETDSDIPDIWLTHINDEYGFEISYPDDYIILKDENIDNWPNAIIIITSDADSYDLPIEVWDNPSDYENKYSNQMDSLTVKQVNNKYITLLNNSDKNKVDDIIATFIKL